VKIRVIGLNHKTAPISVREKLTFSGAQVSETLIQLKDKFPEAEFALLSTCNRTEIYLAARRDTIPDTGKLIRFISDIRKVETGTFKSFLYVHDNEEAVRHLLTVATSLDSLVVGESQIVAQVKESYRLAVKAKCTGKVLNRLFHCAFATSKEVYTLTSIAQRRVSVAGVAIGLAKQLFENIAAARVAVIGAGEMGELLVRHLLEAGCKNITVFNRTFRRAGAMAEKYNIAAGEWEQLRDSLLQVDIVVAAVQTKEYLFEQSCFTGRREGTLLIIDIAVPRNFDPAVNELEGVHLYSVDNLADVIQENIEARQEDVGQAKEIIADNVVGFMDWFGVMDIGPLIGKLRKRFHQLSKAELESFLTGESDITTMQKQKMEAAVNRIVDKLLHRLINNVYTVAREYGPNEAGHLIKSIIEYEDQTGCSGCLICKKTKCEKN